MTSSFVVLGKESRASNELMGSGRGVGGRRVGWGGSYCIPALFKFLFIFPKIIYLSRQNSNQDLALLMVSAALIWKGW